VFTCAYSDPHLYSRPGIKCPTQFSREMRGYRYTKLPLLYILFAYVERALAGPYVLFDNRPLDLVIPSDVPCETHNTELDFTLSNVSKV